MDVTWPLPKQKTDPWFGNPSAFWSGKESAAEDTRLPSKKDRSNQDYFEPSDRLKRADASLDALSSLYTVPVRSTVESFLMHRRKLRTLLFAAYPRLVRIFPDAKLELRLIEDMEDNLGRLRVSIAAQNRNNARQALDLFEEEWWLDHVQDSGGLLDFTLRRG
jgi:hypothetical protein